MNISTLDIKKRYSKVAPNEAIFSYLGSLTYSELDQVLKNIELLLTSHSSKGVRKKLFNLLVEITQNLFNYLKQRTTPDRRAVFIFITEKGNTYKIVTGNYLLTSEIPAIKSRIEMVNSMNNEELKKLYRGILDIGLVGHGGGAGLGFIDLARKSGRKLSYDFEEIDDKFSFFTLEVSFSNG